MYSTAVHCCSWQIYDNALRLFVLIKTVWTNTIRRFLQISVLKVACAHLECADILTFAVTGSHLSIRQKREKTQQEKRRAVHLFLQMPDATIVLKSVKWIGFVRSVCVLHSYLATWHYPVGDSQERQTDGDPQDCPALHSERLLP